MLRRAAGRASRYAFAGPACSSATHRAPGSESKQLLGRQKSTASSQQMDLGRHFYLNKVLEQYAAKPATRTTLRQLVFFGKTLGRDRDKILKSANYVRHELAVRIAHRIRDLQALPFVVMTNKHLEEVYEKYWTAFEIFRKLPTIQSLEDNEEFCSTLKKLLADHLTIIPSLTIGIVESSHHLSPEQLDSFMERMLRSRISRRVLAEQHIALSEALDDPFHFFNDSSSSSSTPTQAQLNDGEHVGIIYTSLKVSNVVQKAIRLLTQLFEGEIAAGLRTGHEALLPEIVVDGALEARFAYIPEHLEYILFELLKNSMLAVLRQPLSSRDPVCIRVTIVEGPPDEDLIIRISDCGGGLPTIGSLTVKNPKREGRRKFAHRVTSKKRRELLEEETAAVRGEKQAARKQDQTDDFTNTEEVHDEMRANEHSMQSRNDIEDSKKATAYKAGNTTDALVATVTSFSNIRRRLEMEEERLARQEGSSAHQHEDDKGEGARRESPGREKEGIERGLRTGLRRHEQRASGIDSWVKIEALRNVGQFKGTVAEQMADLKLGQKKSAGSTQPSGQNEGKSDDAAAANSTIDGTEAKSNTAKAPHRAETGLGLPMTKIYTDFFGGSLSLRSLDGHGLDVFVRLPKLGTNKEAIEDIVL